MTATAQRVLTWAPRILCVLLAVFLSVFALDVFGQGRPPLLTMAALAMHLIPSALVLLLLALAWRQEWLGAIVAAGLGLAYLARKSPELPWTDAAFIAGPLFLIASLFAINALLHARERASAGPKAPAA